MLCRKTVRRKSTELPVLSLPMKKFANFGQNSNDFERSNAQNPLLFAQFSDIRPGSPLDLARQTAFGRLSLEVAINVHVAPSVPFWAVCRRRARTTVAADVSVRSE